MNYSKRSESKKTTPAYLRLVADTVYSIQRIVISSSLPETIKGYLIQEMETAVEACERFLPEKQFTLIITGIPSIIRNYIQMYAEEISLNISISDESRKICARKLLEKKLAQEIASSPNKIETFLQILWLHFNLKDFRNDTNHISKYVRAHLREEYRITIDEHTNICAFLTRPEYVAIINKIRAEIKRLELTLILHKTIFDLRVKPEYENISETLNRIIKYMSFIWKYKCCKKNICEPLYYMREAVLYSGANVSLALKHALNMIKKIIKTRKINDTDKSSSRELKIVPSSALSVTLSMESSYTNLLEHAQSSESIYETESINRCNVISSVSIFSYKICETPN